MFASSENVYFIEDDMNCLEYGGFVKQFDFIIASRFHAIVHAYKENVPAIILGWAVKYHELAKNLNQEKFVFRYNRKHSDWYKLSVYACRYKRGSFKFYRLFAGSYQLFL